MKYYYDFLDLLHPLDTYTNINKIKFPKTTTQNKYHNNQRKKIGTIMIDLLDDLLFACMKKNKNKIKFIHFNTNYLF